MGRKYKVLFEAVACSAAQDLVFIPGPAAGLARIIRHLVGCTDTTYATEQALQLRARLLPATVSTGSGGTTGITPSKADPGDAASTITTAATNNTTQATTSGTAIKLFEKGEHIKNGSEHNYDPSTLIASGEAFVFELLDAPSGTVHLSGFVELEQIGG